MTPDEEAALVRTAHHEAAHFCAGWLFGRPPELESIRPGQAYAGIVIGGRYALDGFEITNLIQQQPADHRATIEGAIVATLAGPLGTQYARVHSRRATSRRNPMTSSPNAPREGWLPSRHGTAS